MIFAYGDAMHPGRVLAAAVAAVALIVGTGPAWALPVQPRVVNGRPPEPGEIRALVSVQSGGLSCGGTLVDSIHVITAAHCVVDSSGNVMDIARVKVGWSSSTTRAIPALPVIKVAKHPDYSPVTFANDLAVLTLPGPIPGATPMLVANASRSVAALAKGASVRSAGYGYTWVTGPSSNTTLVADLIVIPDRVCGSRTMSYSVGGIDFYGFGSEVDTANAVCAIGVVPDTTQIIDTCQGDSGGPLYAGSGLNARLVGVVSVGDGCAGYHDDGTEMPRKRPGVYARTGSALQWLASEGVDMSDTSLAPPVITSALATGTRIDIVVAPGSSTRLDTAAVTATPSTGTAAPAICTAVFQSGTAACTITGLASGQSYAVTAIAAAGDLVSDPSSPVTVTIGSKPGAPRIRETFILGKGKVEFIVAAGRDNGSPLTSTTMTCVARGPAKAQLPQASGPVVDGSVILTLKQGMRYTCRATSTNYFGSTRSAPLTFLL